ncbi:ATP-binding cassette domain-containing protein [Croceicoccus marinus]|jgi:osmoprotectant transport system ATP-binding protein|uniref:ATP-binding cassette domain-containing protein n=2 Tax=Croceicoccus marinus TaxID=450378 RepID=A0A7G6VUU9_9SPHN|nr:ATP-binding cassette domain-containing protein [Croceicoccus marinus]
MDTPMIELSGLALEKGGTRILRGIDLAIAKGEFVAVIGASGAGKTSLLRCINALVPDFTGSVLIGGQDTAGLSHQQLRRGIGYVLQNIGLFPHRTVAENIGMPSRIAGRRRHDEARVAELLDMMELPADMARRYPAELSGGQAQRVAIARALYSRPALMLLDEPFGALDPATRASLGEAYRKRHDVAGLTSVMVTHDVAEALALADRVLVMHGGKAIAFAPPAQLAASGDAAVRALVDPPLRQARALLDLKGGA